jgi:hypothetical protein
MSRSILFVCLLLPSVCSSGAEICKWVDEAGLTHYGDCPKSNSEAEQIEITSGPSDESQQQAQEELEKLIGNQEQNKEVSKPEKKIVKEETKKENDTKCLGSPTDTLEPISPRQLTPEEYNKLSGMFGELAGYKRWVGDMEEIICYGAGHDPPMGMARFKVDMKVEQDSRNVLTVESDGRGIDDTSVGRQDYFWLLLTKDWLRFGSGNVGGNDAPKWDVGIISVGTGTFKFKRRGPLGPANRASIREFQFWSFHVSSSSLRIKELIYTHYGFLDRIITWTLKR